MAINYGPDYLLTSSEGPYDNRDMVLTRRKGHRDDLGVHQEAQKLYARLLDANYQADFGARHALTRIALAVPTLGICATPRYDIEVETCPARPMTAHITVTRRKTKVHASAGSDIALNAFLNTVFK